MKPDFSIVATWDNGRPLEELNRLMDIRIQQLGEAADGAIFACGHTVLRSIKPLTRVAKVTKQALKESYDIVDTGLVMGQMRNKDGKVRWKPHQPMTPVYRTDIKPIFLWGGGIPKQRIHVYRVTPRHAGRRTWRKNLHKGCWYLAAYDEGTARHYTESYLMMRAIKKYAGLARASVASMRRALAAAGNEAVPADAVAKGDEHIIGTAERLARVQYRKSGEVRELEVASDLSYGRMALGDMNALEYAIAKAANSVAGYIRSRMVDCLNRNYATPFPEITKGGSMRR